MFTKADLERMVGAPVSIEGGVARIQRANPDGRVVLQSRPQPPARATTGIRYKSKWEARYAGFLDIDRRYTGGDRGAVQWFGYEVLKLRLAAAIDDVSGRQRSTWYTADFAVLRDGRLCIDEVKGFWRETARAKMKIVAQQFPMFPIRIIEFKRGTPTTIEAFNT